jgi:hypothetical protein
MTDSSGNLSVDFLVGFTIFMVAFIWVATLVPNLLLGVSAHGVDFDAVAYRTGVILAEDPGAPSSGPNGTWEFQRDTAKDNILRFGLAVSKDTPNILSEIKVNRFFDTAVFSHEDYRKKAIFGDYPYRFNISLLEVGRGPTRYVGDVMPSGGYGYIRKEVKIKHFSNATIDKNDVTDFKLSNTGYDGNVTFHDFSIAINTYKLLNGNITSPVTNPNYDAAYQINPMTERINITIQDLDQIPPQPSWITSPLVVTPPTINLTKVTFSQSVYGEPGMYPIPPGKVAHVNFTYDDGNLTPVNPPVELKKNVTFVFEPGFFNYDGAERGAIYINMTFGVSTQVCDSPGCRIQGMQFLNTSKSRPWDYNYNPVNVTQPVLNDAVLEVAVW